jgi:succinoglycan biosynthesis protein ExoA
MREMASLRGEHRFVVVVRERIVCLCVARRQVEPGIEEARGRRIRCLSCLCKREKLGESSRQGMAPDSYSCPRSLNDPLPFITVIMPAFNEEAYIRESLLSLISTGYPQNRLEIIVADGNSTDRTKEEVAKVSSQYSFVRVINNPQRLQSAGCNLAAAQADPSSEYYIRVDAHSKWSDNFLPLSIQTAEKTGADLVVFVNAPVGITPFQKALAYALQHPLGVGNSLYRLGSYSGWVDHGQHGCFHRSIWETTKGYNESKELWPNEDVELSFRITGYGGKIYLNHNLRMSYYPRSTLYQLARQYYRYGVGRCTNHRLSKKLVSCRQAIPPLFVALSFGSIIAFVFGYPIFTITVLFPYFFLLALISLSTAIKLYSSHYLYLFPIFATIHFTWGAGFLVSATNYLFRYFRK